METQWASFDITEATSRKNAGGDGINYDVTLRLIDHKNDDMNGKEFKRTFSSKAMGMMIPLVAAVQDKNIEDFNDDFDFDYDGLKNKKIDGKITTEMYMNRPVNKVEEYLPYGKSKSIGQAF